MASLPDDAPPVAALLDLSGQVAIVTGASRGIGAGIAARLAEAGAAVVVGHRDSAAGAEAVMTGIRDRGGQAVSVQADVAEPTGAASLLDEAVASFGRLDIVVNNAGVQPVTMLADMTVAEWDALMAVNLRGVFLLTQAAARRFATQGGGGAIVNVASIEGKQPAAGHSHYSASKAGVLMHTRAAAAELGGQGTRVNAVAPGLISAPGLEDAWPEGVARWRSAAPLRRLGHPSDVADACLFLASPAARWITGAVLRVDGGVLTRSTW